VDLELECQTEPAATSDDIHHTVDYAHVADRVIEIGARQDCALLETFAERLLTMLFAEFPIERVKIWLRKLAPPLEHVTGSVGVQLERSRLAHQIQEADQLRHGFLTQQLHRLPKGKALDVAAGSGRNALYLASHGFQVDAVDRDEQAMAQLAGTAKQCNIPNLRVRTVDLERTVDERPEFPKQEYDVIVVFFYLHRALFPALIESLKPNGVLIYETFTIDNYLRHRHPRRWNFASRTMNCSGSRPISACCPTTKANTTQPWTRFCLHRATRRPASGPQQPAARVDMSRIDLHLHTIHSDGSLSPDEVLRLAHKARVTALAITDHDIVSGIPEAIAAGLSWELKSFPAWKSAPALAIVSSISLAIAYSGKTRS